MLGSRIHLCIYEAEFVHLHAPEPPPKPRYCALLHVNATHLDTVGSNPTFFWNRGSHIKTSIKRITCGRKCVCAGESTRSAGTRGGGAGAGAVVEGLKRWLDRVSAVFDVWVCQSLCVGRWHAAVSFARETQTLASPRHHKINTQVDTRRPEINDTRPTNVSHLVLKEHTHTKRPHLGRGEEPRRAPQQT